jgi:nitrate/nitrite transporter NarK
VLQIGLYSAIPYAATAAMMIGFAHHSDKHGERSLHVAGLMFASALSLGVAAAAVDSLWIGLVSVSATTCFLWSAVAVFWAIPAEFLKGTAAAGGIAFINSIGLLGGFVSPSVIGFLKTLTGSIQSGLWAMVAILVIGALLLLGSRPPQNPVVRGPIED